MEEAGATGTLAAGHDGSGWTRPTTSPLVGFVCQRVLQNMSGVFPHHDSHCIKHNGKNKIKILTHLLAKPSQYYELS